jgi:Holliday junction DNA helicase RuvB
MEDFQLDLIIGTGPAARSVKIDLAPFTLIGATTRAGLLTNPLRDRFGIPLRLNFYTDRQSRRVGARHCHHARWGERDRDARPRHVGKAAAVDRAVADRALVALDVDQTGLDAMDRRYLTTIAVNYAGGPVGVETIAAALSESRDAIEEIIEPFLIQQAFVQRTPRGRLLTAHAFRHLGLTEPRRDPAQFGLFGEDEDYR